MKGRPAVPKDLRRRILEEAGYRCAIPTCHAVKPLVVHHVVPYSSCKEHHYPNLICLCRNCHELADRKEIPRSSMYRYKKRLQRINKSYSDFEYRVLVALNSGESVTLPKDFLQQLGEVEKDHLVDFVPIRKGASSFHVILTDDGKRLMKER